MGQVWETTAKWNKKTLYGDGMVLKHDCGGWKLNDYVHLPKLKEVYT